MISCVKKLDFLSVGQELCHTTHMDMCREEKNSPLINIRIKFVHYDYCLSTHFMLK